MSNSNLPQVQPPERNIIPPPNGGLARIWNSVKKDAQFCAHAIKQEYAESRWYKIMSTIFSRTNKITNTVVGSGIATLTILFIYTNREFLLLNKRWVAITLLSVLAMFLMWVTATVRRFHERTIRELKTAHEAEQATAVQSFQNRVGLLGAVMKQEQKHHSEEMEKAKRFHAADLKATREAAKREYESIIIPLRANVDSLKSQLEELRGVKLRIEVDTLFSSTLHVRHNTDCFKPPEIEPIQYNQYDINAHLFILFENEDSHQINALRMDASLMRITRNGNGRERRSPMNQG